MTSGGSSRLHEHAGFPDPRERQLRRGPASRPAGCRRRTARERHAARLQRHDERIQRAGEAVSDAAIELPDRWVSSVITGPSSRIQITTAPATDKAEPMPPGPGLPGPACRAARGEVPPAAPAAAAGLAAQLTSDRGRD